MHGLLTSLARISPTSCCLLLLWYPLVPHHNAMPDLCYRLARELESDITPIREKSIGDSLLSNKEELINQLNVLAAHAYHFRKQPLPMGGGGGSYEGYSVPEMLRSNKDGTFEATILGKNLIQFKSKSSLGFGSITVFENATGDLLIPWLFEGRLATGR